jgi:hypothetical protein
MATDTESLLKEARDRLAAVIKHDSENRKEAAIDHAFLAGEQWDADDRRMRTQVEQRPCLTINKLPAFVHQVVNDQRQNRPSIKVHPVDSDADPEIAEVIQGAIKYIEYNSNADACYDTAVSHATIGGFGYFRLGTEYTDEASFDQEIKLRRVQNPFTVYIDPWSVEPDGSDMNWCFVTELVSREEFEAMYPKAKATSAESLVVGTGDTAVIWMSDDSIRVAEYYKVKVESATLVRTVDGQDVFEDELQPGQEISVGSDGKPMSRKSEKRTVCWYKITGTDILEETEIPCKWIPVFPVYGDEHVVNGRIRRNGMVRWARDPQRMYNFWMTSATEEVALRPKTPFVGAVGQFETAKKSWQQANRRSFPFLEYDPVTVDGNLAGAPQRQQMADVPTGVLAMAMHASDNIKATTGIFDASLGAKGNETSGRAITARQREGDTANMHFADNMARTLRHAGRCIVNMMPKVYDTPRIMRILGKDEKMDMVPVNQPLPQPELDDKGAIKTVLNDLTVGKYDVTIGVGPSYTTQRAEAVDAMLQLGQNYPMLWQAAGDKIVRAMDWPGADEIADRLEKTIPPQLLENKDEEQNKQPLPPQVQQALQQAAQEIQQLQQALQEAQSPIAVKQAEGQNKLEIAKMEAQRAMAELQSKQETEQARIESQERIASMNNETKHEIAELQGMIQMLMAKMEPPPPLVQDVSEDLSEEKGASKPDALSMLAEAISGMNKPKRKRMSIVAPSGQVYQGEIADHEEQA